MWLIAQPDLIRAEILTQFLITLNLSGAFWSTSCASPAFLEDGPLSHQPLGLVVDLLKALGKHVLVAYTVSKP